LNLTYSEISQADSLQILDTKFGDSPPWSSPRKNVAPNTPTQLLTEFHTANANLTVDENVQLTIATSSLGDGRFRYEIKGRMYGSTAANGPYWDDGVRAYS